MKNSKLPFSFIPAMIIMTAITIQAADLYVSAFGGNIQAAINAASANDVVYIEDGVYVLSTQLSVTKNITLRSINGPDAVTIQGNGTTRCLYLGDNDCHIRDLTITGGMLTSGDGAGIYCFNGSSAPVISNCVVTANTIPSGFYYGGGVFGGTLIDCSITDNFAPYGGGVAEAVAERCRIQGNGASNSGAGAFFTYLTRSVILNNAILEDGGFGGGLSSCTAEYCAISGNNGYSSGGGSAYSSLYNCTVTRNVAGLGGGSYEDDAILNCIVWHNTITGTSEGGGGPEGMSALFLPPDPPVYEPGTDIFAGGESYIDFSCSPELDTTFSDNINDDPLLANYAHVSSGSPCIGSGNDFGISGPDIDGDSIGASPSMGCDEHPGPGMVTGPLVPEIWGPALIATEFRGDYAFAVHGAATLTVAEIEDFGVITNPVATVYLSWDTPGTYDLVLTAWNNTYPGGLSVTQSVTVVSAQNTAVYVSDLSGNDANDGSSWAASKKTIQAGVDTQTIPGGMVIVSNGTYNAESFPVLVDHPLKIRSLNGAAATVIDAGFSDGCLQITAPQTEVRGFTVTGGFGSGMPGAGIYCSGQDIFARECIVSNNLADETSGMYQGTAVNCLFTDNYSYYGGTFAYGQVGNSAFAYNTCEQDSALFHSKAWNCTVTANLSLDFAGGAYWCELYNCIVWGNNANGTFEIFECSADYSCCPDLIPGVAGNITDDPLLASFSRLTPASPCIGAGHADYAFEHDIDGQP